MRELLGACCVIVVVINVIALIIRGVQAAATKGNKCKWCSKEFSPSYFFPSKYCSKKCQVEAKEKLGCASVILVFLVVFVGMIVSVAAMHP